MPIFGYTKQTADEDSPSEMKEVTLDVPLGELRRVAAFLVDCADRAESGEWRSSHRHIGDYDRGWTDCDVIVMHPSPEPPLRVG